MWYRWVCGRSITSQSIKSSKHLRYAVQQRITKMKKDLRDRRTICVTWMEEFTEEFYEAHFLTKLNLNNIYNSTKSL